ncbi:MAG: hypothetical protein IOD15_07420 [Phycisphaerales bacterium]|jgi:hypothetical protein|nr:hypothetical protein [Phycisphaerales bacterium]
MPGPRLHHVRLTRLLALVALLAAAASPLGGCPASPPPPPPQASPPASKAPPAPTTRASPGSGLPRTDEAFLDQFRPPRPSEPPPPLSPQAQGIYDLLLARLPETDPRSVAVREALLQWSADDPIGMEDALSPALHRAADALAATGLQATVTIVTPRGPGAGIKTRLLSQPVETDLAGGLLTNTQVRLPIGMYAIWVTRNGVATSDPTRVFRVIADETPIVIEEDPALAPPSPPDPPAPLPIPVPIPDPDPFAPPPP